LGLSCLGVKGSIGIRQEGKKGLHIGRKRGKGGRSANTKQSGSVSTVNNQKKKEKKGEGANKIRGGRKRKN